VAAHFHLFDKVVKLNQPFHQVGNDGVQKQFCLLLSREADCNRIKKDWMWLQTHHSSCLSPGENAAFDASKYIVSTNEMRSHINYKKLSMLSPIMQITENNGGVCFLDEDDVDGKQIEGDGLQMYAVGAEVMLTYNMWIEAGLVNRACGKVVSILKPMDGGDACIVMVDIPGYCGPALSQEQPCMLPITQIWTPNFNGMPLTLAWAITIHKAQGMTMDWVMIDLEQKEFSSGLTFIALS
jgi:ATP-dependent DNA helicase PIF1